MNIIERIERIERIVWDVLGCVIYFCKNYGTIMHSIFNTLNVQTAVNNPALSVGGLTAVVYHLRIQTTEGKMSGVGFVKE